MNKNEVCQDVSTIKTKGGDMLYEGEQDEARDEGWEQEMGLYPNVNAITHI